jgi:hypothetical protein
MSEPVDIIPPYVNEGKQYSKVLFELKIEL